MTDNSIKANIITLKEMVLDEQKLVTYVSLSKDLCVHVNESKALLYYFVNDIRKTQPDTNLNVNYIVSGITKDNKARTTVCSEIDIVNVKNTFKKVFFYHLYSVSKGKPIIDNVSFLAVNKFDDFPLCTGFIKNVSCVKRTVNEISTLKTNSQELMLDQKKPNVSENKIKENRKASTTVVKKIKVESKENGVAENNVTKVHENKSEPIIKTETSSPKKDSQTFIQKNEKNQVNKSQKGIPGFFSQSNSLPNKKNVKNPKQNNFNAFIKKELKERKDNTEKMDVDKVKTMIEEKTDQQKCNKNSESKEKSENKLLNEINKNVKVNKKRKRILNISDSESEQEKNDPYGDEDINNHESDDEIPPTPSINPIKITSGIVNPKKRRKIVDKTYTDEDGYILTKKEEVYESCSEDDEQAHTKENIKHLTKHMKTEISPKENKNGIKNAKKKVSPPKGKQASIMSFFKKSSN